LILYNENRGCEEASSEAALKAECEKVYRLSMPWADDILMEKLVEKRYLQIIETMDHDEYEKDLADLED
jgi:3-methyladenine DNA glycosylase AlkC